MKKNHPVWQAVALAALCGLFASCTAGVDVKNVCGTLDAPVPEDTVPAPVLEGMSRAMARHECEIMSDAASAVSVSAIVEVGGQGTAGLGLVVAKGRVSTTFPQIRHTRQPRAVYDSVADVLWLAASAMAGTGVQVERLYQVRFQGDSAVIGATIDPYDVQQAFCRRLGYSTDGAHVTLYADGETLCTVENSVTGMGRMDEEAVWIGEQICYLLGDGAPRVCLTPGVKFASGPVLFYDDMPPLTADITLTADGSLRLGPIR